MYPQWLDHLGPCGNRISWTRFISVANLLAFFAHLGGVIVAAVVNNEDGDFSQPSIDVYIPSIDFQRQSKGAGASFELKPVLEKLESPLSLRWLAISFFAISAFFHLVIFVDAAFIGRFYFKLIHECKAPFRWIEYSVSASVMLWTIAFAGGLKDIYLLVTLAVLCFVTMTYGCFTEALSRPNMNLDESRTKYYVVDGKIHENRDFQRVARSEQQDESPIVWGTPVEGSVFKSIVFKDGFYGPPTKWLTRSPWERLRPHLLGYIPYLTAYGIILHSFYHNTSGNEQGPPEWVHGIVWGQFALFTVFGLSQAVQQASDYGCANYIVWEAVYILLSLVAKMVLGLMLVVNVFFYSSFDEAVATDR